MKYDNLAGSRPALSRTSERRRFLATSFMAVAAAHVVPRRGSSREKHAERIRHSIAFWCFNQAGEKWSIEKACEAANQLGCASVELVDPVHWKTLRRFGLTCAIAPNGMPGAPFQKGFNNVRYRDEVTHRTKEAIDASAEADIHNVIAFTGLKWRDAADPSSGEIDRVEGADQCVIGLKEIARHAEKRKVTVCIEMLNSRDASHPMKGHPGYSGDCVDYVADIVRRVGSPAVKLLFDVYHVQIMNGDVIRRLEQYKDVLGHVHTAGNPGRGELDERQEINYTAVMLKLAELGYDGVVGHEFIPTRDPMRGLQQAIKVCSV